MCNNPAIVQAQNCCIGAVIPGRLAVLMAVVIALRTGTMGEALADETLAVCAIPSATAGGLTLLLDPVDSTPVALVSDPNSRLIASGSPVVMTTRWGGADISGPLQLRLSEVQPEFWAQPVSWRSFLRGPDEYAGWGVEVRARDWAGVPMTDRRSYRLDPGLKAPPTYQFGVLPGVGTIRMNHVGGALQLAWTGFAGRTYQVHYSAELNKPSRLLLTIVATQDGETRITLPASGAQGFFRVANVSP